MTSPSDVRKLIARYRDAEIAGDEGAIFTALEMRAVVADLCYHKREHERLWRIFENLRVGSEQRARERRRLAQGSGAA
jgi:hypothetical protein